MYVYGDIITDARVNRAACALANNYDVTVISTNSGKQVTDKEFKNHLIGTNATGMKPLFQNIWAAYQFIKQNMPDVVYCHDYYSALLAYLLAGKKYCSKIIYDAHELIIPEEGIKDRRTAFFRWFEKRIINKVDLVICASEDRGQFMEDYYKMKKRPLVIRNISQLSINNDEKTQELLASLEGFFSNPCPTVVYAGVVIKSRGILNLVKAVSDLAPNYKLLLVGQGDALEEAITMAKMNPQLAFSYTGTIPYASLGAVLSKCDIGYVFYPNTSLNNRYCASNKLFEYASVRLPIIANTNPTVMKELAEGRIGVSSDNLTEAIEKVAGDISSYKFKCDEFTEKNPWSQEAEKLIKTVRTIF